MCRPWAAGGEEVPGGCGQAAPRTPGGLGDDASRPHLSVARCQDANLTALRCDRHHIGAL
jgi:hypothetical protein